ncbi:hypothetical protein B0T17DRAFT_104482 [Bombardia bombarda]|uniref:Uncharacterized protein n=1 Tax=Bombardia bombarda TaxID=252184 RepID=A0AA39XQH4_9PEZI|nr:hypothetical protein B0T17DRAFT_104482 [Bombardia bombarda]
MRPPVPSPIPSLSGLPFDCFLTHLLFSFLDASLNLSLLTHPLFVSFTQQPRIPGYICYLPVLFLGRGLVGCPGYLLDELGACLLRSSTSSVPNWGILIFLVFVPRQTKQRRSRAVRTYPSLPRFSLPNSDPPFSLSISADLERFRVLPRRPSPTFTSIGCGFSFRPDDNSEGAILLSARLHLPSVTPANV